MMVICLNQVFFFFNLATYYITLVCFQLFLVLRLGYVMFSSVCYWVHECMFVLTPPQHYEFLVLATW